MTHDTIIESVRPVIPTSAPRVDAWRFIGIPSFEAYVARVLKAERERAQRSAA